MTSSGLIGAIHWLEGIFDRLGLSRSYGGAIAYNYYGPPRLTQDVDILALLLQVQIPPLVQELGAGGCERIDGRPLDAAAVAEDLRGKARFTLLRREGIPIELFVPWHPFHRKVLSRSPERELEGRRIRIHAPEDLIVFKKIFDRPKDIQDIKAMLMAQRGRLDTARLASDAEGLLTRESWRELKELVDFYR